MCIASCPLHCAHAGSDDNFQIKFRTRTATVVVPRRHPNPDILVRLLLGGRRLSNGSGIVGLNARVVGTIEDTLVMGGGWVSWGVLESN